MVAPSKFNFYTPDMRRSALTLLVATLLLAGCDSVDNQVLLNAAHNGIATEVTVSGTVTELLADFQGPDGHHQAFDLNVDGLIVEIDHNIDLAPRVPLQISEQVVVQGQFEPDPGHPIIHYTHHATGQHVGGYIQAGGQTYE